MVATGGTFPLLPSGYTFTESLATLVTKIASIGAADVALAFVEIKLPDNRTATNAPFKTLMQTYHSWIRFSESE